MLSEFWTTLYIAEDVGRFKLIGAHRQWQLLQLFSADARDMSERGRSAIGLGQVPLSQLT